MKLTIDQTDLQSGWLKGTYNQFEFSAKVFSEGSSFGINQGRVSKLFITEKKEVVFNYDRGVDMDAPIGYELAKILEVVVPV